jgi:hypothetical protein
LLDLSGNADVWGRRFEQMRVIPALGVVVAALVGCRQNKSAPDVDAGSAIARASAEPAAIAATAACVLEARGAIVIPDSAHATDIHIAAAGSKALVTFWESKKRAEGPNLDLAIGHVFDAAASSIGPRMKLQENGVGDEPVSNGVPIAVGGDVSAISCAWAAPAGRYGCSLAGASRPLFEFSGIATGGPEKPDIAAVMKDSDAIVVVPVGGELQLFASPVSAKTKDSPFGVTEARGPAPDALNAALTGDAATIVYRRNGAIQARRAGFDQKWRGKAIDVSAKGALVGAPAIASEGERVVALFSQRAKASDPWKLVFAEIVGESKLSDFATGPEQAQGPGIAKAAENGCFHVSWVEGSGETTRTKLARACGGSVVAGSVTTLSSAGVEGGRAYLASDGSSLFAVWQELPEGKPAELRVAKLACK